jgi:hypothetical protein
MNEHTWEKEDADMRSEMSEQYIQERCPHEDLYVNDITVKVQANPVGICGESGSLEQWQKYLAEEGTSLFEMYIDIVCEKCGASQEQWVSPDEMIDANFERVDTLRWIE